MSTLDTEVFRAQLEAERERVAVALGHLHTDNATSLEDATQEIMSDNHPSDVASEIYSREVDQTLEENEEHVLAEIDAALARIAAGTYGLCESCGAQIGADRLEAVPWATLVRTSGKPALMFTARAPPSSFKAMCPWSWYMATTPSNSPRRARTNKVSLGQGPVTSIPSAAAAATAGAIKVASSSPNNPPSLACGFRAATPKRGRPSRRRPIMVLSSRIFSSTASTERCRNTSRNAMCSVTWATASPSQYKSMANCRVPVRSARISV